MGVTAVFLCLGLVLWIHVSANELDAVLACEEHPQINCSDNLCKCCNTGEERGIAFCDYTNITYIPRVPNYVWFLSFSYNNLSAVTLTEQFFSNVTNVTHLFFVTNAVRHVGPDVFSGFKSLQYLNVMGNIGLTINSIKNMLSIPGLLTFIAIDCDLPAPPVHVFKNITSDINTLALSAEKAGEMYDMTAFCSLRTLQSVAVREGRLNTVKTTCVLHITYLDLIQNNLFSLPVTCNNQSESLFPQLKSLVLSGNNIRQVGKACLPELNLLDLSENKFPFFIHNRLNIVQFPNLRTLSLSGTINKYKFIYGNTFSHPTLQTLVLDGCNIDFSITYRVASDAFAGCPRLTNLSMMGNVFNDVDDARFLELFGKLNLSELLLSKNKISAVSWRTFNHFHNLQRLDLVNTGLSDLPDGVFSSLTHILWLDISDNQITAVTESTLGEEMRQQLQFLGLGNNPFICSCDLVWFRNWFESQPRLFLDKPRIEPQTGWLFPIRETRYMCNNLPGTNLTDFMMADQACVLSQSVNVAIILVTSAMIITLTTVSLVFRFRWHIRLALYEVFRGRGNVRRMRLHANRFDYDVFVSYTKEDLPWVREHLMPELEGRLGLRLCVHERDFIPGNNIVDNIVECVQSSKKILMVFSKDFVHSQWCQFELTFCLTHVMDYDDTLLIVCVDDVTSRDMTPAMMAVLKTTTYIQWGDHGDAVVSFWGRLRLALHEVTDMVGDVDRDMAVDRAVV